MRALEDSTVHGRTEGCKANIWSTDLQILSKNHGVVLYMSQRLRGAMGCAPKIFTARWCAVVEPIVIHLPAPCQA